jgi:hypothetical protein
MRDEGVRTVPLLDAMSQAWDAGPPAADILGTPIPTLVEPALRAPTKTSSGNGTAPAANPRRSNASRRAARPRERHSPCSTFVSPGKRCSPIPFEQESTLKEAE